MYRSFAVLHQGIALLAESVVALNVNEGACVASSRIELLQSRLLGVYDTWQTEGEVPNLIAVKLFDLTPLLGETGNAQPRLKVTTSVASARTRHVAASLTPALIKKSLRK